MSHSSRRELGVRAEALVEAHLSANGFSILGRNVRVGRREIDLIARRGGLIVVCEVRARSRSDFVSPLATIDARKIRLVREAASVYLRARGLARCAIRFDAAAVLFDVPEGRLEYVENAF
jgi:putative endonuclease